MDFFRTFRRDREGGWYLPLNSTGAKEPTGQAGALQCKKEATFADEELQEYKTGAASKERNSKNLPGAST